MLGQIIFDDVLKGTRKIVTQANKKDFDFNRLCDLLSRSATRWTGRCWSRCVTPLADDYESATATPSACLESTARRAATS